MLIGARHDDHLRNQIGIIGDQNSALARIYQLVGLKRKATDFANRANVFSSPSGAQRVGRVLDYRNISRITQRHNRIHIRCVTAHVTNDNGLDTIVQFGRKIGHINAVICANLNQNRGAFAVYNGRGNGRKSECRDQHICISGQLQRF